MPIIHEPNSGGQLWSPSPKNIIRSPNAGGLGVEVSGADITPGTSGAYGSYAQAIASLPYDVYIVGLQVLKGTPTLTAPIAYFQVALAVGPASGEQDVCQLKVASAVQGSGAGSGNTGVQEARWFPFPIFVPGGTRLAARAAQSGTETPGSLSVRFHYVRANQVEPPYVIAPVGKPGALGYQSNTSLSTSAITRLSYDHYVVGYFINLSVTADADDQLTVGSNVLSSIRMTYENPSTAVDEAITGYIFLPFPIFVPAGTLVAGPDAVFVVPVNEVIPVAAI